MTDYLYYSVIRVLLFIDADLLKCSWFWLCQKVGRLEHETNYLPYAIRRKWWDGQ